MSSVRKVHMSTEVIYSQLLRYKRVMHIQSGVAGGDRVEIGRAMEV